MATGQVLFHRFYFKKSFVRVNVKTVAATCIWLAAKLEETPRMTSSVVNVFHRLGQRRKNAPLELLDPLSKKYEELTSELITTEKHLLLEMGYICHVEHPHKFVINYVLQLDAPQLMQDAWSMANDSLRTTLCVRFRSEVIACGVVYIAARKHMVPLPENPPWWDAFNAKKSDIDEVCRVLARMYKESNAVYIEVAIGREVNGNRKPSTGADGGLAKNPASAAVKESKDEGKAHVQEDSRKQLDDAQVLMMNADAKDDVTSGKVTYNRIDTGAEILAKEKDSEKVVHRERKRDREIERDRERERERDGDREREQERDRERESKRERDGDKDRYRDRDRERKLEKENGNTRESDRKRDWKKDRKRDRDRERDWESDRERDWERDRKRIREKTREKDRERERSKDRDRERDRARKRSKERDHDKDRECDKKRERLNEREHYMKERSSYRNASHTEKSRYHSSSRERDLESHHSTRDKHKHRCRHHRYE